MKKYDSTKRKATDMNLLSAFWIQDGTLNDPGSLINTRSSIKAKLLLFTTRIKKPHTETCLGRTPLRCNQLWLGQVTRAGETPSTDAPAVKSSTEDFED